MNFTKLVIPRFKVGHRRVRGKNEFWKENSWSILFLVLLFINSKSLGGKKKPKPTQNRQRREFQSTSSSPT